MLLVNIIYYVTTQEECIIFDYLPNNINYYYFPHFFLELRSDADGFLLLVVPFASAADAGISPREFFIHISNSDAGHSK